MMHRRKFVNLNNEMKYGKYQTLKVGRKRVIICTRRKQKKELDENKSGS